MLQLGWNQQIDSGPRPPCHSKIQLTGSYSPGWELPLDDPNACGRIFADEHQIFPRWGTWNCELTRAVMCGFSTGGASSEDSAETTSVGPICPEGWEVSGDICVVICPEGWTRSGGSCFKYLRDHYDWDAGAQTCRALDGRATLATIIDDEQNLAVAKLVTGTGDAWIGRQLLNGNEIWKSGSASFLEICMMDHDARQLRRDFKIHARRLNTQSGYTKTRLV